MKKQTLFNLILIIIVVVFFALSFYVDWIGNHYSQFITLMFVILMFGTVIFNIISRKNK